MCVLFVGHRRMYNTMYQKSLDSSFFDTDGDFLNVSDRSAFFIAFLRGGLHQVGIFSNQLTRQIWFWKFIKHNFATKRPWGLCFKGFGTSAHEPAPPAPAQRITSSIHQTQKRRICILFLKTCNGPEGIAVFLPINGDFFNVRDRSSFFIAFLRGGLHQVGKCSNQLTRQICFWKYVKHNFATKTRKALWPLF